MCVGLTMSNDKTKCGINGNMKPPFISTEICRVTWSHLRVHDTKKYKLLKLCVCSVEKLGFYDTKGEKMKIEKHIIGLVLLILFMGIGYADANVTTNVNSKELLSKFVEAHPNLNTPDMITLLSE